MESEALCAEAQRRTGLKDFGEPPIQPALSVLTDSLEQETDLHPLGRFLIRAHLLELLETRLRLAEAWRRELQACGTSPISRPIFITGMPRSGSTFLHELLAEDPAHRAPRVWEVMYPASARTPDRGWCDPRVWKAATCLWWFRRLAPRADKVHPMRSRTPHECVAIHSYTLLSEEFVTTCRVPAYETFLRSEDLSPAYLWQRRLLQHLQTGREAARWVLKSPDHVHGLEALFSVFPDALIIQTHRNPLEALTSLVQLNAVLQELFGKASGQKEIAEREARVLAGAMERFIRFRDDHPEWAGRFVDVNYPELVADPLAVVRRIYEHFEIPLTQSAEERMRRLAMSRSRYSRAKTKTAADIDGERSIPAHASLFESYCRRFGVACQ